MQPTTYLQRTVARLLLVALLLQSCNNWNAPSPKPTQGQEEKATQQEILLYEQPTHRFGDEAKQPLAIAGDSWQPAQQPANLPIEIIKRNYSAPSTPIQQVPATPKFFHKGDRSLQAGPKVVIQSPTTNSSLPTLDNAAECLLDIPLHWKSREGHTLQQLYLVAEGLYAKVTDKASEQLLYDLPVYVFPDISLNELAHYPTQQISYYLHITLPKNQEKGKVILSKGGLRGGVKDPGNNEGKEAIVIKESKQQEEEKPAPTAEKEASLQTSLPAIAISTLCHMGKILGEEHYLATAFTILEEQATQGDLAAKQRLIKKLGKLGTLASLREKQVTILPISWREKPLQALQEMVAQHYQQALNQLRSNQGTVPASDQAAYELGILQLQYYYCRLLGPETPNRSTLLQELTHSLEKLMLEGVKKKAPESFKLQRLYLSYLVEEADSMNLKDNKDELRAYVGYVDEHIAKEAENAAKAVGSNVEEQQALRQLAAKHYRKLGDMVEGLDNANDKGSTWQRSYYTQAKDLQDRISMYRLSLICEKGILAQDKLDAETYLKKSAEKGYSLAQHKLAVHYEKKGKPQLAMSWHKLAADQGHPISLYTLYLQASKGDGSGKEAADKQQAAAFAYLIQAAQAGHAQTQYELGNYYWQQKQYEPAIKWYEKAAYQGIHEAYAYLGVAAAKGLGRQENPEHALDYYMRAEKVADNPTARYGRARLYEKGKGIAKNLVTALNLYTEASLLGLAKAAYHAGRLHLLGETPGGDHKQACELLKKAAQGNIYKACLLLGRLHEYGWGGKVDLEAAIRWYQGAASAKNQDVYSRAQALYQLGWLYRLGKGVEANEATALNYFEQAALVGKDKYVQLQQAHEALTKEHQEYQETSKVQLAQQKADYEKLQGEKEEKEKQLGEKEVAYSKLQEELKKLQDKQTQQEAVYKKLQEESQAKLAQQESNFKKAQEEKLAQETQRISQVIKKVAGDTSKLDEAIKVLAPNGEAIVKALANNSTYFHPDGSTFTEIDMAVLVNHPRFKQLTYIDLSSRRLNAASLKMLAPFLKGLTNLQYLYLQYNQIGDEGAKALGQYLSGLKSLQRLYLQDNKIGNDGVKGLAVCLQELTNLQDMYLHENQIGDNGAKSLAAGIKGLTNLKDLNLQNNQIGAAGAKDLAASLQGLINLQNFSLGVNQIGDEGAKVVTTYIKGLTNLQYLYLHNNQIGDEGAKAVAINIKGLTKLPFINLQENHIGDEGAKSLGEHLPGVQGSGVYLYKNHVSQAVQKELKEKCPGITWNF